jgi:predicted negative regulator of RcsB-dependent stress response
MYSEMLGDILLRLIKTEDALSAYKRAAFILSSTKHEHDYVLDNKIEYVTYLLSQSRTAAQDRGRPDAE